jgi:hypothetical protein
MALSGPALDANAREAWSIEPSRRCVVPPCAFEIQPPRPSSRTVVLRFTPAEWRHLLEDASFLSERDNCYSPRRLMGLPVEIVPDHRVG